MNPVASASITGRGMVLQAKYYSYFRYWLFGLIMPESVRKLIRVRRTPLPMGRRPRPQRQRGRHQHRRGAQNSFPPESPPGQARRSGRHALALAHKGLPNAMGAQVRGPPGGTVEAGSGLLDSRQIPRRSEDPLRPPRRRDEVFCSQCESACGAHCRTAARHTRAPLISISGSTRTSAAGVF